MNQLIMWLITTNTCFIHANGTHYSNKDKTTMNLSVYPNTVYSIEVRSSLEASVLVFQACPPDKPFKCHDGSRCFKTQYVCDDWPNYDDGSHESNCQI